MGGGRWFWTVGIVGGLIFLLLGSYALSRDEPMMSVIPVGYFVIWAALTWRLADLGGGNPQKPRDSQGSSGHPGGSRDPE